MRHATTVSMRNVLVGDSEANRGVLKYQMIIQVPENHLSIEVSFSTLNREPGFDDDIRIGFLETGDRETKLFKGNTVSFLITPEQAKQFAQALLEAAEQSQNEPKR